MTDDMGPGLDVDDLLLSDELEQDGAPMDIGAGATLFVRSSDYKPFRLAYQRGMFQGGRIGSEKQANAAAKFQAEKLPQLIAKYLVVGWSGLTSRGQPLEYSDEVCLKLVPRWSILDDIKAFADDRANYVKGAKEEVGNELKAA